MAARAVEVVAGWLELAADRLDRLAAYLYTRTLPPGE